MEDWLILFVRSIAVVACYLFGCPMDSTVIVTLHVTSPCISGTVACYFSDFHASFPSHRPQIVRSRAIRASLAPRCLPFDDRSRTSAFLCSARSLARFPEFLTLACHFVSPPLCLSPRRRLFSCSPAAARDAPPPCARKKRGRSGREEWGAARGAEKERRKHAGKARGEKENVPRHVLRNPRERAARASLERIAYREPSTVFLSSHREIVSTPSAS